MWLCSKKLNDGLTLYLSKLRNWALIRKGALSSPGQRRLDRIRHPNRPHDDPHVRLRPQRHHWLQRVLRPLVLPRIVAHSLRPLRR